jgi:hypothetical protein
MCACIVSSLSRPSPQPPGAAASAVSRGAAGPGAAPPPLLPPTAAGPQPAAAWPVCAGRHATAAQHMHACSLERGARHTHHRTEALSKTRGSAPVPRTSCAVRPCSRPSAPGGCAAPPALSCAPPAAAAAARTAPVDVQTSTGRSHGMWRRACDRSPPAWQRTGARRAPVTCSVTSVCTAHAPPRRRRPLRSAPRSRVQGWPSGLRERQRSRDSQRDMRMSR